MALKWADGNGGVKDVLPTASTDVKGGIKVGQNLYMTADSLNASPMGGVSFGGGLSFTGDTLTFNPLEGLPIGGGLSFVGGALIATPGVYWGAFPVNPQQGCIAFVDDKPYFYGGSDWVPFCQCSQGGDSGSSDPPAGTYVAPQISTRTVPCTLTLHYPFSVGDNYYDVWNWNYESDGWTFIVLPEYVTSRDQITITGANGEIIEPLTIDEILARMDADEAAQEEGLEGYHIRFIEFNEANPNAGWDNAQLRISEAPEGDLATQLRWNHWVNDGHNYSMQINISFNMEVRNIIAGANSSSDWEWYCVNDYGNDFYKMEINTSAGGTAINAQGTPYRDDGSGSVYFDGKPASVVLDEFDPENDWELGGLSINWNDYSGATVLRMDLAGETPEVIRTQHFTDAASHSSAMVVDLPFTNAITLDECGLYSWEQVDNNNDSRYNPTIENGVLRLYSDNGISLVGEIVLGGQDFTIDGIYMACQVSSRLQRIFSMQTAIDKQNGTYTIALMVNQGPVGVYMEFAGSSNTNGTSSGVVRQYWHHFALVYQHEESKAALYIDGVQVETATVTLPATGLSFDIGNSPSIFYNSDAIGWYSHFRVFQGVAVWTDSFTIDVNTVDSLIGGVWRYVNAGTADLLTVSGTTLSDLPATQSKTSTAFYQTGRAKCFDVPATPEVWMKFDVFFNGSARWRAYNENSYGATGIAAQTSGDLSFFANDSNVQQPTGICIANQLQTVLLHMVSGSSAGVVEAWVDGNLIYTYTGNVNKGADFADIYLQSDGAGTFFSNVIISSGQIGFSENLY